MLLTGTVRSWNGPYALSPIKSRAMEGWGLSCSLGAGAVLGCRQAPRAAGKGRGLCTRLFNISQALRRYLRHLPEHLHLLEAANQQAGHDVQSYGRVVTGGQ